jgi:hypothetical protein
MNYETQQFIPCDCCGEEFPQHMVSNRFADSLTCDTCSEEIARDFEIVMPQELSDCELDDWASQYDDDPNPYSGTYSEL